MNVMFAFRPLMAGSLAIFACTAFGQNLVVNGDFEAGNTGFGSDLAYSPTDFTPPEVYSVDTNPNNHHNAWLSYGDHTSGSGLMLIANGSINPVLSRIWFQTLNLTPGASYDFEAFVRSSYDAVEGVYLSVDGVTVAGSAFSFGNSAWTGWNSSFVYTGSGTSVIGIHTASSEFNGNDITVDDISLTEAVPEPASMLALSLGAAALLRRRKQK